MNHNTSFDLKIQNNTHYSGQGERDPTRLRDLFLSLAVDNPMLLFYGQNRRPSWIMEASYLQMVNVKVGLGGESWLCAPRKR